MINLKAFRKANHLTQIGLADYLGVGQGFISQIEKGGRPIPKESISKLLANPHGWDVSMLTGEAQPELVTEQIPTLSNAELLLRDLLAERDAKIDALQEIIWELKEENGRLKEQLRAKKGDAQNAVDSSCVVA